MNPDKPPAVKLIQLVPMGPEWGSMYLGLYSDGAVRTLDMHMEGGTVVVRYVPVEIRQ